ncbi:hypothetical protein KR093_007851, partial [Drosophila rubida]
ARGNANEKDVAKNLAVDTKQIAQRRLKTELALINRNAIEGCKVQLIHDNLFRWLVTLDGADETPYEGGRFLLRVIFPPSYPFDEPKVEFITRIYHCNVRNNRVCEGRWSPVCSIGQLFLSIRLMMISPDLENAASPNIAKLYLTERKAHDDMAREWTDRYARCN